MGQQFTINIRWYQLLTGRTKSVLETTDVETHQDPEDWITWTRTFLHSINATIRTDSRMTPPKNCEEDEGIM